MASKPALGPKEPEREAPAREPRGYAPPPSTAAFRDLLIFEERLKQNAARLQERKKKYQGARAVLGHADGAVFLLLLCSFILWMLYYVMIEPAEVRERTAAMLMPDGYRVVPADRPALGELYDALPVLCERCLC